MELRSATVDVADLDSFLGTVDDVATTYDVTIQAFDAALIAGPRHLERARELADRAIDRGENVARDRAVEILLYAAGRRQIDDALQMGVSEGETRAVFLVDGPGDETVAADALADALGLGEAGPVETGDSERIAAYFEITDAERAATDASLEALVCERVALLAVEK